MCCVPPSHFKKKITEVSPYLAYQEAVMVMMEEAGGSI